MADEPGAYPASALDLVAEAVRRADKAEAERDEARRSCDMAWEDRRRADLALERERQARAPLRQEHALLGNLVRTFWAGLDEDQRDAFQANINHLHREALFYALGISEWPSSTSDNDGSHAHG